VRIGVIAMQVGIFSAASVMGLMLMQAGDIMKISGTFIYAMSIGFTVSILALVLNMWLDVNIRLLSNAK
jgi:hypothetical protein